MEWHECESCYHFSVSGRVWGVETRRQLSNLTSRVDFQIFSWPHSRFKWTIQKCIWFVGGLLFASPCPLSTGHLSECKGRLWESRNLICWDGFLRWISVISIWNSAGTVSPLLPHDTDNKLIVTPYCAGPVSLNSSWSLIKIPNFFHKFLSISQIFRS
jgi:hypothetical protein